jgi:hypothetical protein
MIINPFNVQNLQRDKALVNGLNTYIDYSDKQGENPLVEVEIDEGVKKCSQNEEEEELVFEETLECCATTCNESTNGEIIPSTLRIPNHKEGKTILELIDSESTHNFIHSKVVQECRLKTISRGVLSVQIVKGKKTIIKILNQNQKFSMGKMKDRDDFFIMEMNHYDVILGTKFLQKLRVVKNNFEEQWIEVQYIGVKSRITRSSQSSNYYIIIKNQCV